MKVGHKSRMAKHFPSIFPVHGLSWDYQRIADITGMALYPWALETGCTVDHDRMKGALLYFASCLGGGEFVESFMHARII